MRLRISPKFIRLCNRLSTVLLILVLLLAFLLVGVRLFGLQPYVVTSGSMVPDYPVGSLIYVREAEPSDIGVDDVITFRLANGTPATHRVIGIHEDSKTFTTRGDANYDREHYQATGEKIFTEDPPVPFRNLIGKPVFTIPYLGYLAYYIQNPPGLYVAIALGALILLLMFLPDLLSREEKSAVPADPPDENSI